MGVLASLPARCIYKNGATTGRTIGEVVGEATVLYLQNTTISVEEVHEDNMIQAKATTIGQVCGGEGFAKPGPVSLSLQRINTVMHYGCVLRFDVLSEGQYLD